MLKSKITAAEFAGLHDEIKKFYLKSGEDYLLQSDGAIELRNAHDREKLRADGLKIQVDGLTQNVTTLTAENTSLKTKNGDVLAVESQYKAQIEGIKQSHATQLAGKDKQLHDVLVVQTAQTLAATMAGDNAHLLAPIIEKRLAADTTGEKAVVRILDAEGKPSALKLDELQKELVDSGKFKAILIASKGSGGAASTQNQPRPKTVSQDKPFKDLTEAERKEWYKTDPDGFNQASAAARRVV